MSNVERRAGSDRRKATRIEVFWRGKKGSEGEAASNGTVIILSDDHGTVLTYSREAFEAIINGWGRLVAREDT